MLKTAIRLYKDAYTGLTKESWYLSFVMLVNRSGTMVLPFMTIYCTQKLHFSIAQAGTVVAFFGLGAIAGAFVGGKLTDRFGFYVIQIGALFSGGCFFIIDSFLTTFPLLCAGTFLLSMFNESFRPANSTAIASYSDPENRTRSYSLNRLAINLGWAVGGSIGGFLASINYSLLFWVDGATNIVAALLMLWMLPYKKIEKTVKSILKPITVSAYRDKTYLLFIGLSFLFAMCFFQLFTMVPVYFKTILHINEQNIGILMALNGVFIVLMEMVLIFNLEGKHPLLMLIRIGVAIVGVSFLVFNIFPGGILLALLSVVLVTFGEILSMPFMNTFWISRTSDDNRGEYAALYTISWSSAQVVAPIVGSLMVNYYGFAGLWWLISGISFLTAGGYWLLHKSTDTRAVAQTV